MRRLQYSFFALLLCTLGSWGQAGTDVPFEEGNVHFEAHPPSSVTLDFTNTRTQKAIGHFELSADEWHKFAIACRKAADMQSDPNDPYFQHVEQKELGSFGDLKVWCLIEPDTTPDILVSNGRRTLADVGGKYIYLYLKTLHDITTALDGPSSSPSP